MRLKASCCRLRRPAVVGTMFYAGDPPAPDPFLFNGSVFSTRRRCQTYSHLTQGISPWPAGYRPHGPLRA